MSLLFALVERDHGGCDDEECSIRQLIEDGDQEEAVLYWAMSGAACPEFNAIYEKLEASRGLKLQG